MDEYQFFAGLSRDYRFLERSKSELESFIPEYESDENKLVLLNQAIDKIGEGISGIDKFLVHNIGRFINAQKIHNNEVKHKKELNAKKPPKPSREPTPEQEEAFRRRKEEDERIAREKYEQHFGGKSTGYEIRLRAFNVLKNGDAIRRIVSGLLDIYIGNEHVITQFYDLHASHQMFIDEVEKPLEAAAKLLNKLYTMG